MQFFVCWGLSPQTPVPLAAGGFAPRPPKHLPIANHCLRAWCFYCYYQYLNCKLLHGGTLLQPWPNAFGLRKYLSDVNVIPLPKLIEDQKNKVFTGNWSAFSSKLGEDQKKKVFAAIWDYIWPEFGIYSCWLTLFRLNIQRPNLDRKTSKSRRENAKSRWGDANSRWGDASPRVPNTI